MRRRGDTPDRCARRAWIWSHLWAGRGSDGRRARGRPNVGWRRGRVDHWYLRAKRLQQLKRTAGGGEGVPSFQQQQGKPDGANSQANRAEHLPTIEYVCA